MVVDTICEVGQLEVLLRYLAARRVCGAYCTIYRYEYLCKRSRAPKESFMYPRERIRQSPCWEIEVPQTPGERNDPGSVGRVHK
jgi:hypothetical protein